MMDRREQRSKKRIFIIPGFQGRVIFLVVVVGFACATLNSYLYYAYVVDSYDFILRHSRLSQELIDERYSDLYFLWAMLTLLSLAVILIVATWAVLVTHRAAGSVYHIRRVIDEIRSGNVKERVHLREKDEFQDVANAFNQMMDELQKH